MRHVQVLSDAMRAFAEASAEPAIVLTTIARQVSEALHAICGFMLVADGKLQPFVVEDSNVQRRALIERIVTSSPLAIDGAHPFSRALATGESVQLPEITEALLRQRFERDEDFEAAKTLGLKSVMFVPLRARGTAIGGMTLIRCGGDPFDAAEEQLARGLGDHAALAIANAQLVSQLRDEVAENSRLADRSRVLSELSREFAACAGDYAALLELVVRRLGEVIGESCGLRVICDDGTLETRANYDPDPVRQAMLAESLRVPQRLGEGISGKVAATGVSALIPQIETSPVMASVEPRYRAMGASAGIKSLIVVALRSSDRIVGTLTLFRAASEVAYTVDDLRLVEDVAAHASLAMANTRLLEASKRELATEAVLRRGFLEAAPDAVVILDARGHILLVNSQTETLFGYSRSELVGRSIDTLVSAEESATRKDGTQFIAEITRSPIETPDGTLVAAAIRDVTERRRELEERARRTQEASRLKSEFLANMSHELRTPLNAVIGFATLMHTGKAGPLADDHKEYIGDILNSARHLLQLINDVLDLSKVEAGRLEIRVDTVDVSRVVGEVRDILRGIATDRSIRVAIELDNSMPTVRVDARLFKQILYNYLSNAIKYNRDNGRVTVRVAATDDDLFCIEVEDTGIGIKAHDIDRLFVEFQQLDQGTSKKYPGTGLGLALTKRIVEAQGGSVGAKSTYGQGSTFSAVIPRNVKG